MFKLTTLCSIAALVIATHEDDLKKIDGIFLEDRCARYGGRCVLEEHCPLTAVMPARSLCPIQQALGVECCYTVSTRETRCAKASGTCTADWCYSRLVYHRATDCPENTKCCVRGGF